MSISAVFEKSYDAYETYPHNVIVRASCHGSSDAQSHRFNDTTVTPFVRNEDASDVVFRDFEDDQGTTLSRENVKGDSMLRRWLGESVDPLTGVRMGDFEKVDPKCRFVFLWADSSRAPLKISKRMFLRLMSYHQVMPSFLDFISVFGSRTWPRVLRFSGFREQTLLERQDMPIDALRRSSRQYQISYNLKSIHLKSPSIKRVENVVWSIRQAAMHHQFDVVYGTTLWIIAKGNLELQKRVKQMTSSQGRPSDKTFDTPENCFRFSLSVHLMCVQFSSEEWRPYVQWLEDVVDLHTSSSLDDSRSQASVRPEYTLQDLQTVQGCEDRTNEAVIIMEANVHVLTSLGRYYEELLENTDFDLRTACRNDIRHFKRQLDDIVLETTMQVRRVQLLVRIIGDRKVLVLQYLPSQATEKMEILTISMHNIGGASQREAIIMRIITVAALIYLPATFVSSFFSTDVVKYQNQPEGGTFSSSAMNRWLEVTLPLTFVTLVMAILWFIWADRQHKKELYSQLPEAGMKLFL